jgi:spore germination cell wall hydrolase CwlJ-like protein
MAASRTLALGGCCSARFWLSAFCVALMPSSIGYQEIATLLSPRSALAEVPHPHLIPSPFGTIEPATYSYGRQPIGTAMPQPPVFELASFDPNSAVDAPLWTIDRPLQAHTALVDYPTVNRRLKGDRWPAAKIAPAVSEPNNLPQPQPIDAAPAQPSLHAPPVPAAGLPLKPAAAPVAAPYAAPVAATALINDASDLPAEIPASGELSDSPGLFADSSLAFADDGRDDRSVDIYFGATVTGSIGGLERWAPGAAPILAAPPSEAGLELAALQQPGATELNVEDMTRQQSPAQRLGLTGKVRAKAEKCLADAVYFEARGEPLRGQEAVAQVVMNRVFSGYYPNNVCGVVYQNASHYLGCQFTFACEHKDLSRIDEPDMWAQAKRIAKDTLDGKIWLADIGHATHYHAYWVHPSWVHEMTRLYKLGVHTFYRPRAWGNGDYEPVWGKPNGDDSKPQAANVPRHAATAKL